MSNWIIQLWKIGYSSKAIQKPKGSTAYILKMVLFLLNVIKMDFWEVGLGNVPIFSNTEGVHKQRGRVSNWNASIEHTVLNNLFKAAINANKQLSKDIDLIKRNSNTQCASTGYIQRRYDTHTFLYRNAVL